MDIDGVRCRSREESEVHHRAHYSREEQLAKRERLAEKQIDTFVVTPLWKLALFGVQGWPPSESEELPVTLEDVRCRSCAECEAHHRAHYSSVAQLEARVRRIEKELDTFLLTPLWKRTLFAVQGWPWRTIVDQPTHRLWHSWTWHPAFRWSLPPRDS